MGCVVGGGTDAGLCMDPGHTIVSGVSRQVSDCFFQWLVFFFLALHSRPGGHPALMEPHNLGELLSNPLNPLTFRQFGLSYQIDPGVIGCGWLVFEDLLTCFFESGGREAMV